MLSLDKHKHCEMIDQTVDLILIFQIKRVNTFTIDNGMLMEKPINLNVKYSTFFDEHF